MSIVYYRGAKGPICELVENKLDDTEYTAGLEWDYHGVILPKMCCNGARPNVSLSQGFHLEYGRYSLK